MPSPRRYTTAGAFRRALEERLKRASMADQVDLNRQRIGRSRFTPWRRNVGSRQTWPRCLRRYRSSSKECWYRAQSGERGMTENGSESLPFEPPEQENIRLRGENARLRRLLASGSQYCDSATRARESASSQSRRDCTTDRQRGARPTENRAIPQPVSRERRCLRTAMAGTDICPRP